MIREKVELDQNSYQKASVDEFLPPHWSLISLLDLCELGPTVNPEKNPLSPFTYVDVSGVSNESFCIVETKQFLGKNAPSRARKLIQTQDVIFATVRPTLRRVALVSIAT
jgi:type I restriction enzyme S subunit